MKGMQLVVALLAVLGVAFLPGSPARAQGDETISAQTFVEESAQASQFAIAAAQEVLKKSLDLRVKRLAQGILEDYQQGYQYIAESAASAKLRVPDRLDADKQARLDRLTAATVDTIDQLFMAEMRHMHEATIALFANYVRAGDTLRLRLLSARALPTIRDHYADVQQLASR